MAAQWAIEILATSSKGVGFRPDVPGANIGDPLQVQTGDLVIWSNRTIWSLTLVSLNPAHSSLDQTIPPGRSSASLFLIQDPIGTVIQYRCLNPLEDHLLQVV